MKVFFESIFSLIKALSALNIYTLLLGFISLLYLVIFKYDGPWNWDDMAYLLAVFDKTYFPMVLGRSGFCYPFVAVWSLVNSFNIANFLFIEQLILISNLVFQVLTYIVTFRLLVAVKVPVKVAFVTALLLLAELSYSVLGSRYSDTPLMQLCVLLSYYLYVLAHERRQLKYLFACGLVSGYSILTREAATFNLLFFPVVYAWYRSRHLTFPSKEYGKAFCILIAVAVSGPLLLLFIYETSYINVLMRITPHYFAEPDILAKINNLWRTHVNGILLLTGFCGLVVAFFRMKRSWLAAFSFICLTPVAITFFIVEQAAVAEARFYFGMFLLVSLGSAFLITGISEELPTRKASGVFTVLATLGLMFSATYRFWPQYQKELQISRGFQKYYLSLNPLLNQRSALIAGNESIYMIYRTRVEFQDTYVFSAGQSWPKGRLSNIINRFLGQRRIVLYDPKGDGHNKIVRAPDLARMREEFRLTEFEQGLFKVEKK